MRVALVTTSFPLHEESTSGPFISRLVDQLAQSHSVKVITPCSNTSMNRANLNSNIDVTCCRYAPCKWQKIAHQPGGIPIALQQNRGLFFIAPFMLISMFFSCLKASYKTDIFHAQWSLSGVVSGLAGYLTNTPTVTTIRGSDVSNISASLVKRCLLKACLKLNKKIIFVSDSMMNHVIELYPEYKEKMTSVFNGVDDIFMNTHQSSATKGNVLRIITAGNLIRLKDTKTILEAVSQLPCKKNIRLTIVGDGPEKLGLESFCKANGIDELVDFTGTVALTEMPRYLKNADVFILASLSEGRPNAMLEAMASNLTIVGSDIDGIRELITDNENGLLFHPGNVKELTGKIQYLFENPLIREVLANKAQQTIFDNALTWEKCAEKYTRLYNESLAGRNIAGNQV